ncbi:hypothetical protein LE181_02415 [Streptomyces sp. SCA3-4]|uniref:hypothetical protein n=1 Tax=Streptomyces sichuanensis TaxID=2871810 RepID=UPI001CE2B66C|nr:hypothetical protein [Streptomyces sichuanensis]MCA6091026.1 hypothetical protein [Streptomyces sichuanensis]
MRGCSASPPAGGRLAPAARRGLAHLARLAGDFPTALETARTLGWEGRHHRALGDIWWTQGAMDRATAAYETARAEAEQHGIAGERATAQAQLAFVTAFTDPQRADDELDLALAFHHAVRDASAALDTALSRLEDVTQGGDYSYYTAIAHFMAARPLPARPGPPARWLNGEEATRDRWHTLVTARRGGTR